MTDSLPSTSRTASTGLHMMWAVPRSRSTAFLRMMIERGDILCLHEPFCALRDLGSVDLKTSAGDVRRLTRAHDVVDHILKLSESTKVFVKETTDHAYDDIFGSILFSDEVKTTLMIRDPEKTVASHLRKSPSATIEDIGYHAIFDIGRHLIERKTPFLILESEVLVQDPVSSIQKFCNFNIIPFLEHCLNWDIGHRQEWSRAQHWHDEVAATSGFQREEISYPAFSEDVQSKATLLTKAVIPEYQIILSWRDRFVNI